jgi:hypothetical protein
MSSITSSRLLTLSIFDRVVQISCQNRPIFDLLANGYGSMLRQDGTLASLEYAVNENNERGGYCVVRAGCPPLPATDDGELIFLFEKDLTIELQRLRADLYFVHAAALEFAGNGILLVAPSGQGKSTVTWGLLHHGFRYLSDELAPLDLRTMKVAPYPHALCLKREPPEPYPLPAQILRTSRTFHVPTPMLPNQTLSQPVPVTAMFFLEYSPKDQTGATLQSISKGEAASRLFAQALNPLAHMEDGLPAAIAIACNAACYKLRSADIRSSCDLVSDLVSTLPAFSRQNDGAAPGLSS